MRAAAPGLPTHAVITSLFLGAAVLLAGCASGNSDNPFTGRGATGLRVTVDNNNVQDVTVYLMAPAVRQRLGRVGSHDTETFTVRWTHTQELRLELNFLAGPRCYSFPVTVSPGDEIEMVVQPGLTRMNCR